MKVLAAPIVFNEEVKIASVLKRFPPDVVDKVLVMDDGSTDNSPQVCRDLGFEVLSHDRQQGVGAAIRTLLRHAKDNGFDIAVILAGNDKDRPAEIPLLVKEIEENGCDFVQGSRYLGKSHYGDMPFYRKLATRLHPFLFSIMVRKKITDSTNGFRAIKLSLLDDERINLDQEWLDKYELEPYLFFKAIKLGYKVKEVGVSKIYPPKHLGQTKMKPITGWWSILRPIFLLGLGIKK